MARRRELNTLSPGEIVRLLLPLYEEPVWHSRGDAVTELVFTILSQNTSDTNSLRAFASLRARFPAWGELMAADPEQIAAEIQVGGLARVKAPRIKAVLEELWRRRGSFDLAFLTGMPLPEAKEWLRSLTGVGPKTAACVLMFALGRPALPVDTHVHRVAQRLGLVPGKMGAAEAHDHLEAMLEPSEVYPFHKFLIEHGRRLCRARCPLCSECLLRDVCPTVAHHLSTGRR